MVKKFILTAMAIFFASESFASSLYIEELPLVWSSIITVSGGTAFATPGKNQYLYPYPYPFAEYFT